MKKIVTLMMTLTILVTACTAKPTEPVITAADVQASAVAMAFTFAAETQAAIPTATVAPPTSTATSLPLASPTTFVLPTFPSAALPTATVAGGDPCNGMIDADPQGPRVNLLIDNRTKGWLSMSLYHHKDPFGYCGFARLPYIGANSKVSVSGLPEGCYYPSVYVNDPKKPRAIEGQTFCMHTLDKVTLIVDYENITIKYP